MKKAKEFKTYKQVSDYLYKLTAQAPNFIDDVNKFWGVFDAVNESEIEAESEITDYKQVQDYLDPLAETLKARKNELDEYLKKFID